VLAVVFGRFVAKGVDDYAAFVLAGTLAWTFVASTLPAAATSIVDGSDLSTRIYFPRSLFPLVSVAANLYGFALGLVVLLVAVLGFGVPLGLHLLLLVPAAVLAVAFTTALSLVLAAAHVHFRDVRYLLQAVLLAWFYVTPVIYPIDKAGALAPWLRLNPATGLVELFHAATVGAGDGWVTAVAWSVVVTVLLTFAAVAIYRNHDRLFADLL
jgi:lipopolysaccharide transport system permease protein